jgi:SAM-dependent methyltransferase
MEYAFLIFELIVAFSLCVYVISITASIWFGAPFVPTNTKDLSSLLERLVLTSGMRFYELGCGDGRVICYVASRHKLTGRGVDISPFWVLCARLRAQIMGLSGRVVFDIGNITNMDLTQADVIYLYMMPRFLDKYATKLLKGCKPGAIVISYIFDIPLLVDKELIEKKTNKYFVYKI